MRHKLFLAMLGAGSLILTGYAQKSPKWTASLKSVQDDRLSENVDSVRGVGTSFGSASWRQGDTPELSVIDLTFSYGGTERELAWAIFVGRCRMASVPIAPVSSFPEIEFTGGGAARVQAKISFELPSTGQYHLNVYKDRSVDEASVVACGDFRYSKG